MYNFRIQDSGFRIQDSGFRTQKWSEMMMPIKINAIGKTYCPLDWSWDTADQCWNDKDLWLVTGGSGTIWTDYSSYNIRRGDCFVFKSSTRYLGKHDPNNPLSVIHIHFDRIKAVGITKEDDIKIPEFYRCIVNPEFTIELAQRVLMYVEEEGVISENANLWMQVLLKEIIRIDLSNKEYLHQSDLQFMINDVCKQINENLAIHYRVKELADKCGYSNDHFTKVFKLTMGVTPEHYMINKRIQSATGLLSESNMTITRISESLGYRDRYHFSKQFKAIVGKSPRDFRKKIENRSI